MKNFFRGMDLNNTIAYMVQKHSEYNNNWTHVECVLEPEWVGGEENYRKIRNAAYAKYELSQKLLNWLRTKPHQLVCQYCGSIHDVKIDGDFHTTVTICRSCQTATHQKWDNLFKTATPLKEVA